MIALYTRVSTLDQTTCRQEVDVEGMTVFSDKCSGSIAFQERPAGKRVIQILENGELEELVVHSLDRLGRDLLDILQTIQIFTEAEVPIVVRKEGLRTLDSDGKPNPTAKMVISILGVVAEMERNLIKERQLEGIAIAKAQGKYLGRKPGSVETRKAFLQKPRTKKIIELLQRGLKGYEIQKLLGASPNTISKVRRLAADQLQSA